ncbi:MAG: hypothetical protein ACJAS4_000450 [Bacteriovoracaceae bacterium]|jgi:hypothetical protein
MKIFTLFITLFTVLSVSASPKYQLLSKSFYITDNLTLIPYQSYHSESYRPKFFPNDYLIEFQSEFAYFDFLKESVILKVLKRGTCFEFTLYQGKVVIQKRFRRQVHCIENKAVEELSCAYLKSLSHFNVSTYQVEFKQEDGFFSSCEARVIYRGIEVNLFRNAKTLVPNNKENSRMRDKWFILDNGNLVSIEKLLFENLYFSEKYGVYFETLKAQNIFEKNVTIEFKTKSGWPGSPICYQELKYLDFKKRELVNSSYCEN